MSAAPPEAPEAVYTGRFAPSPTGVLHRGSALAAIASFLDARAAGGRWLLRMDDLDAPRNAPDADAAIRAELERLGLHWDGPVRRQSDTPQRYQQALTRLRELGATYPCACSRRALVNGVYPGVCRDGLPAGARARSERLRVPARALPVEDAVQGRFIQDLAREVGDFVVHRADGVPAYHLATVLDDADAAVTHVVRGADLLASTPRQCWLQRVLELPTPRYAHVPLLCNAQGQKLSKQNAAPPTCGRRPQQVWLACLRELGQPLRGLDENMPLAELIRTAIANWSLRRVPARIAGEGHAYG
jgi:glutamyl-Q tRNA(Asp) synthetase